MKCIRVLLFITIFGGTWRLGRPTCVLESDFGFILNCAFKKSGLFRVRNLGGVKAHIGLGFSVGDELGFKESISNTENNRRRSSEVSRLQAQLIQAQKAQQEKNKSIKTMIVQNPSASRSAELDAAIQAVAPLAAQVAKKKSYSTPVVIPPFKPISPADERPNVSSNINTPVQPSLMGNLPVTPSGSRVMAVVAVPKKHIQAQDKISSTNFADRTLPAPNKDNLAPIPQHSSNSIQALFAANNITDEALELALLQRQNILSKRMSTTPSTTTSSSKYSKYSKSAGKVMNAPKEYYPVGYDKNFDDNFASRVELPETSFNCGNQKHFPGLYADEDLGCMVFHVCALTDDGLLMKSFLCPESTLFDQSVLKCNWWFYVDCKNSKKLYDSNIPVSKSYQLMKALMFFSTYKKDSTSTTPKTSTKD